MATPFPDRLAFGGDYNPEQWDAEVWKEDDVLMRRAGVNLATVGVFSWALLEPEEGRYDFGWLDAHLDRLHANGVRVDLATPTASPPPWFTLAHPEAMPVRPDGTRLTHGSRDTYCVASAAYRRAAVGIAGALAAHYADHPAVAMWHVHNEYVTVCHCEQSAAAFRRWLRELHGSLDELNSAWGTAFWSQNYTSWEQIQPPRATQWHHNPGHTLDYARYFSDETLAAYREQRDAIRAHSALPVTTNLMLPGYQTLDLWKFGREVDFVGIDHYPDAPGLEAHADIAFGADRARSFGGGKPWLLIEQGTNTVYRRGLTLPREPGEILRSSLGHIARGSDGALFFQWRQSHAGAEMWHSAMVPHAGQDTRIFREVAETGAAVAGLAELAGSTVEPPQVAILWDADSWWALDGDGKPSSELDYLGTVRRAHRTLWDTGATVAFAHPEDDLSGYRAVLAPSLYLLSSAGAASLRRYVEGGGTLLVQYFSGVVDARHHAHTGGQPGGLREVLGIRVEEHRPLAPDAPLTLSDGTSGSVWSEDLSTEGAETVASYRSGALAGKPALTRHGYGAGTAWYLSTRLDDAGYAALLGRVLAEAGVEPVLPGMPPGVDAVRRRKGDRSWLFVLNHGAAPASLPTVAGRELLTGAPVPEEGLTVAGGGVAVVRE